MLAIRGKAIVLLAGTVVLGCDTAPRADLLTPVITQRDEGTLTPSAVSLWAAQVEDSTGPDAAYAMFVPTNWDESGRRLMLFVHGYVDPDSAVTLPNIAALRDAVGAKGFAVAYSSFSENGWAVKDGEQRSHQLRGLFASRFGEPARTYIYGRSM